jgi:hypothetical protein
MPPASAIAKPEALRREIVSHYPGWQRLPPVVAFSAYFDESKSRERGILAVAGYLAPTEQWDQEFTPAWNLVLENAPHRISEFKAADCNSGKGEFAAWTKRERISFRGLLVSALVNRAPAIGIGAAAAIDYASADTRRDKIKLERAAYLWCVTFMVKHVLSVVKDQLGEDRVHILWDDEKHMKPKIIKMFGAARRQFAVEWENKVRDVDFAPSDEVLPLQAADLLAFETFKAMANRLAGFPRKPRKTLRRLLSGSTHVAHYFSLSDWLNPASITDSSGVITLKTLYDSRPLHRRR